MSFALHARDSALGLVGSKVALAQGSDWEHRSATRFAPRRFAVLRGVGGSKGAAVKSEREYSIRGWPEPKHREDDHFGCSAGPNVFAVGLGMEGGLRRCLQGGVCNRVLVEKLDLSSCWCGSKR